MRVLYVISRLDNAGPINQLYNLISCMDLEEIDVHIAVMFSDKEKNRRKDFEKLKASIYFLNVQKKNFLLNGKGKLENIIQQIKPDIVHSEGLPADILTNGVRGDFRWVSTIHGNIYVEYPLRFKKWTSKILIKLHEICIRNMDNAICCSETISKIYSARNLKVTFIQNGVDTELFKPIYCVDRSSLCSKLQLSQDKKIVTIIGSLDERKRTLFLIKSLGILTWKYNMLLVFLGTGPIDEECRRAAQDYNIVFKGQVDNVITYLYCTDIYISASSSEGLPMSVIEAGCCGIPMILSNIPQHLEFSYNKKIDGISYFALDDENSLIEQLVMMLERDKIDHEMIAKHYKTYFSAEKMAEKYIEKYRLLISKEIGNDLFI